MKFSSIISAIFYTVVFCVAGVAIVSFVSHAINLDDVVDILDLIYNQYNFRIIAGLAGVLLILLNFYFIQMFAGTFQKEKNIAFSNPNGEVTISLAAIEGLIKRLTLNISEIKELKPYVFAQKRQIDISIKVMLYSDVSIPQVTQKLQDMIKNKVQETLGIEETINVTIHVVKIVSREEVKKKKADTEEEPNVPFQGY